MNSLSIEVLLDHLNYTDLRAVRKWCKENDVQIIKQGKFEFVFESNFREAYEKPFVNRLQRKYGDGWESVYQLYKEGNIPALNTLHQIPEVTKKTYRQQKIKENSFTEKFKNYEKTKAA